MFTILVCLVISLCSSGKEKCLPTPAYLLGKALSRGRKTTAIKAVELGQKLAELGVRQLIYTDITRDGTLTAPNFEAIAELARQTRLPVIASGGISSLSHLQRLAQLGIESAIIGKALYTGDIDLREALTTVEKV